MENNEDDILDQIVRGAWSRDLHNGRKPVSIWEQSILGRGNSMCKGPEAGGFE